MTNVFIVMSRIRWYKGSKCLDGRTVNSKTFEAECISQPCQPASLLEQTTYFSISILLNPPHLPNDTTLMLFFLIFPAQELLSWKAYSMASTLGKEFDPNRKYKVVLSERLLDLPNDSYAVANVQLDRDLKLPQAVRNATLSPGFGSQDCDLSLTAAADGKESLFSGNRSKPKTCVLIFDNTTATFTLEYIDTQFAFAADSHSPAPEEQSEAALLNTLIEEEGAADEDNPFDWRHQLKRQRTPTPEFEQFRLDTGPTPSPAASPITQPTISRSRQASSPPDMNMDFEEEGSPEHLPQRQADREEFEIGGEESDDEGGLQISWDGASKPKGFRGRDVQRRINGAPISLRSAANSRSPAIGQRSPESDQDVEVMQLGSPQKSDPGHKSDPEIDPAELEFETEFLKAMQGGDEDEAPVNASQAYLVDDSSSESEEE